MEDKLNIIDLLDDSIEKQEEDLYNEESLLMFAENDEVTSAEEGFMLGYLNA